MTDPARLYLFLSFCMFFAAYNLANDRSFRCVFTCLWIGLFWPVVVALVCLRVFLKMTNPYRAMCAEMTDIQKQVLSAAVDLVNGGQDMEEALFCYKTIAQYVINSTYNKPIETND